VVNEGEGHLIVLVILDMVADIANSSSFFSLDFLSELHDAFSFSLNKEFTSRHLIFCLNFSC